MASMQKKALGVDLELADGDRSFVVKMTNTSVDRDGDVLLPDGLDATGFEANPVLQYAHDMAKSVPFPVGTVKSFKRKATEILAKCWLVPKPEDHEGEWQPDTVLHLIKEGVLRAVSVGFLSKASRRATKKDRETFGEAAKNIITRWELVELSVVPVPCNGDALIQMVSKGVLTEAQAKDFVKTDDFTVEKTPESVKTPAKKHAMTVEITVKPKKKHVLTVEKPAKSKAQHSFKRAEARALGKLYY